MPATMKGNKMETFLIFTLLIVLAVLVITVITLNGISEYRKGYRNGINDGLNRAKEIIKQKEIQEHCGHGQCCQ